MKRIFFISLLILFSLAIFAQERPGNNLGKSLSVMKREFPELRFLRTEAKGDFYEDGYPEDGIAMFFYFKNGCVIEECMICEATDGFPKMWFDSLWKSFSDKYSYAITKNTIHSKVFNFGDFNINLIYYAENGKNTALIVYEQTYLKNGSQSIVGDAAMEQWSGTGFALNNGYVVTNHHVVENAKQINILGVNGNASVEYSAKIVSVDKTNDLALLKIDDTRFKGFGKIPYAVRNIMCDVGADVFVLGFPLTTYMGEEIKLTNGIISSRTGFQGDVSTYQISAPVQPGNSGGPLFDNKGNIIGIVNAGIPGADNVGYAIKTSYLFNLVNTMSLSSSIPQTNTVTGTSLADKVRQVKNFVFFIKCKAQ